MISELWQNASVCTSNLDFESVSLCIVQVSFINHENLHHLSAEHEVQLDDEDLHSKDDLKLL